MRQVHKKIYKEADPSYFVDILFDKYFRKMSNIIVKERFLKTIILIS